MSNECVCELDYVFYKGKLETLRVDFIQQLRGELLFGTPTAQEVVNGKPVAPGAPGPTLAISNIVKNSVAYVSEQGIAVDPNEAVWADVEILKGKREKVRVRVTCPTTNAARNVMQDVTFETRD
jgi:hypothetical protein